MKISDIVVVAPSSNGFWLVHTSGSTGPSIRCPSTVLYTHPSISPCVSFFPQRQVSSVYPLSLCDLVNLDVGVPQLQNRVRLFYRLRNLPSPGPKISGLVRFFTFGKERPQFMRSISIIMAFFVPISCVSHPLYCRLFQVFSISCYQLWCRFTVQP